MKKKAKQFEQGNENNLFTLLDVYNNIARLEV